MREPMLRIEQLSAAVDGKEILHDINLEIRKGETHVLMGPNGAGKSTLGYVLMGNPKCGVTEGRIHFMGEDITGEPADRRARAGMFLSFQEPLEVPGLPMNAFLNNAVQKRRGERVKAWALGREMERAMELLCMDPSYRERGLNVGFSGGEKKKAEILQMLLLKPELAILDETDSGLDVDAVHLVSKGIEAYRREGDKGLLIITHSTRILEHLHVDYTHIMMDGRIVATGDASFVEQINRNGYGEYEKMAQA